MRRSGKRSFCKLSIAVRGIVVTAFLAGGSAWAADYREGFDETRPPQDMFEGQLLSGAGDGWVGEIKKGTYLLIDKDTPGAVKLISLPEPQAGVESASVEIFGQFAGEKAGAGLAFGHGSTDGGYYAFVVTPSGGYALYRGNAAGLELVSKGTNPAIQVASVNRLAVELDGSSAKLLVNGHQVYAHEAGAPLSGRVGIVAVDKGAYSFDDFAVSTSAKSTSPDKR